MSFRQVREVRNRKRRGPKVFLALLVLAAVVVGTWVVLDRDTQPRTVNADFAFVNGLYTGSPVTVLGVQVGRITSITPRGDHVRVEMTITEPVTLPADVEAYVLNPSVISDRHLELGPAYTGGPEMADGGTIERGKTHSPISFDELMDSVSVLTGIMGPATDGKTDSADLAQLIAQTATSFSGSGTELNRTLDQLSSATGVFGARSDEIGGVINSLNQLMTTFKAKQVSLDGLIDSMGLLADQWTTINQDITAPLADLRSVFDQINAFVSAHGNDVGVIAENLSALGKTLAANRAGLAEFMDLAPLMMQNLSSTIGPDRRGRIRLNVSSTLTQFATLKPLCDRFPMPLCIGAGLTNPLSFPISSSDPLGIVSALTGGALTGGALPATGAN